MKPWQAAVIRSLLDLCIATLQPFRELSLPRSLPSSQNITPLEVSPSISLSQSTVRPLGRGAAHLGWEKLSKVVLLKSLWHANIAQASCGSLDILPFYAFAFQASSSSDHNLIYTPILQTVMAQFLGWGQGFKCIHCTSLLMDKMNHGTDLFCLFTDRSPQLRYPA